MNLRSIRAVARKEYYHLIRDFRSLYLALIIPLLLILLFGYALSLDVEHIPLVVVDHDHTPQSRDFVRRLDATIYFDLIANLPDTATLIDYLDRNQTLVGIVLPPGWSADLKADRRSPLQVIIDGSDPNYAGNTRAFITASPASIRPWQDASGSGSMKTWKAAISSSPALSPLSS
jgi:ABC-2 type transport system permease protein